jgi:hypothetical protein
MGVVQSLGRDGISLVLKDRGHTLARLSKQALRTLLPPEGNTEARLNFFWICPSGTACSVGFSFRPTTKPLPSYLDRETPIRAHEEAASVMPAYFLMMKEIIPGGGENQLA